MQRSSNYRFAGRSSGDGVTQRRATPRVCNISSISDSGRARKPGSSTSMPPLLCLTQSTMWRPSGTSNGTGRPSKISVVNELGKAEISDIGLKIGANEDVVGLDVSVDDWRSTIMV